MRLNYKGIGHPTQGQLVDFAESLLDPNGSVSSLLAAHIASCSRCAGEIRRMRTSLELVELSSSPAPSGALTQEIILRARRELNRRSAPPPKKQYFRAFQFAACAVALLLITPLYFRTALQDAVIRSETAAFSMTLPTYKRTDHSGELLRHTAALEALSSSPAIRNDALDSPRKKEYRRSLELLDNDLKAAQAALQRNPGHNRANQVFVLSLERQMEDLRDLYFDRSL